MQSPKKTFSIFASDRIRLHANGFTSDGFRYIAIEPFLVLPLDATDQDLRQAMQQCLAQATSDVTEETFRQFDRKAYLKAMGVKSPKAMGQGAFISLENGVFLVSPINKKGRFGDAMAVGEEELVEVVRGVLARG